MDFTKRIALITGAASDKGIGREVASQLSSRGATVILADIDKDGLEKRVKELTRKGGSAFSIKLDVSNHDQVKKQIEKVIEKFGKIDVLVNNAGVTRPTKVLEIQEKEWDFIFDINMKGTFFLTQEVLPHMKNKRYGRIINLGSVSGKRGGGIFGGSHYSAAKAAVSGFTKAVAREMAPYGITVNSVEPGLIGTDITGGLLTDDMKALLEIDIPVGRVGTVEDVAYTIAFLASEGSSYITGESVDINGGSHID